MLNAWSNGNSLVFTLETWFEATSHILFVFAYLTYPIMKREVLIMNIRLNVVSVAVGVVVGWFVTVAAASIAVAQDHIKKREE